MNRLLLVTTLLLAGCGVTNPGTPPDDDDSAPIDDDDATDDDDSADDDDASDDDDAAPPVLLTSELVGDYGVDDLRPWVDDAVILDNGYSVWTISFETGDRTALATVTIPWDVAPPAGGWHVVANQHGTTGGDDICAITGTTWGSGLAGLYGSRGLIGVALDYPGLGTEGPHPYLVSDSEGYATLDSVRATIELADDQGIPTSGRFAVVGLSQGGHATFAAAALHESHAPELDLRAVSVSGPATAWVEQVGTGIAIAGTHLAFDALLTWAWLHHYAIDADPWAVTMTDPDLIFESNCISSPTIPAGTLSAALGTNPWTIFSAEYIAAWQSGDWTGFEGFEDAWEANRIGPWPDAPPVKIWQGADDLLVLEPFTAELVDALEAGGVQVDYEVVPGAGHGQVAHGFLALPQARTEESLTWLKDLLEAP